jgi:D-aminopeptidase
VLSTKQGGYTVGVLAQCNFGRRPLLRIAGVPVGQEIPGNVYKQDTGSIIVVVATDAPLLPHEMKRIAKRVTLGLGRLGSISGDSSGDIFVAFSTANPGAGLADKAVNVQMLPGDQMDALFQATIEATEEAVVNAMVAAKSMTGVNGHTVEALPHEKLREVLKKYNRLVNSGAGTGTPAGSAASY